MSIDRPAVWPIEPDASPWAFGDPEDYPADDLVGIGADLAAGTVLAAYRQGLFPMPLGGARSPISWWSPDPRGVLPLDGLRVSRSLRRSARDFEIRIDQAFPEVLAACADPGRSGAWIDRRIRSAYLRLHELGWAHSVETWRHGQLVGGLYGVAIGGLFCGESMFHRERDASKVALLGLVKALAEDHADRRLIDVQWCTPHLQSLGVREISRESYRLGLPDLFTVPLPKVFAR